MVCATPGTLKSARYAELKRDFAKGVEIIEPDCSGWAQLIEKNALNKERLKSIASEAKYHNVDVVVLGCTHYHWIFDALQRLCGPEIEVIQPTDAVIREIKRKLKVD